MNTMEKVKSWLSVAVVLSVAFALVRAVYIAVDEKGLILHRATINMLMSPEWLEGESRHCVAYMKPAVPTVLPYIVYEMKCPAWTREVESAGHTVPISFWGLTERDKPNVKFYLDDEWQGATDWNCVRKSESFTCFAID